MRTVLEVDSETAKRLLQMAEAQKVSIDQLLATYLPAFASEESGKNGTEAPDKLRAFEEWVASFPADTPPLSDQAISRESIYRDR